MNSFVDYEELRRITDKDGGRMWDLSTPAVHVYTLSGIDTHEFIEQGGEKKC